MASQETLLIEKTAEVAAALFSNNEISIDNVEETILKIGNALASFEGSTQNSDTSIKKIRRSKKEAAPDNQETTINEDARAETPIKGTVSEPKKTWLGTRTPDDPFVPIENSITHEAIICLEDGSKHKTMKAHIRRLYNMTPEQYREKWGLPSDYPLVAPEYRERRSKMAKENKIGGDVKSESARNAKSGNEESKAKAKAPVELDEDGNVKKRGRGRPKKVLAPTE